MGTTTKKYIVETNGSGVGLIDYDNDGWLDIYMVNGSTFDALTARGLRPTPRCSTIITTAHLPMWREGRRDERSLGIRGSIADYDNDGWPDIFVGNFGKNRLYHNNHDGTFTDVAEKAGVTLGNWSTARPGVTTTATDCWICYVAGLCPLGPESLPIPAQRRHSLALPASWVSVMCGPRGLPGEPDHLFHNNGDGTFTDVSVKAGVADQDVITVSRQFLSTSMNDGKPDLLVANDSNPNYLYSTRAMEHLKIEATCRGLR